MSKKQTVTFTVSQTVNDCDRSYTFSFATQAKIDWPMLVRNVFHRVNAIGQLRKKYGVKAGLNLAKPFRVECSVKGIVIDTLPISVTFNEWLKYSTKYPERFKSKLSAIVELGEIMSDMKDYK